MVGKQIPLAVTGTAKVAANGVASVELAPAVFGSSWCVTRIIVNSTSAASTVFTVYKNTQAPYAVIDTTATGNNDIDETDIDLNTLDKLICVWTGGTPNSICTVTLSGTMDTGRPF